MTTATVRVLPSAPCSACGENRMVRADGMTGTHGPEDDRCPGSGQPPADRAELAFADGWQHAARALHTDALRMARRLARQAEQAPAGPARAALDNQAAGMRRVARMIERRLGRAGAAL